MARGEATRRRKKNQERAAEIKSKRLPLGPNKAGVQQDVLSRAMKKMLQLKAAAARVRGGRPQQQQQQRQQQQQQQGQQQQGTVPAEMQADPEPARGQEAPVPADAGVPPAALEPQQADGKQRGRKDGREPQQLEGAFLFQPKTLKGKKKEFLKAKKLKKKSRGGEQLTEKEAALAAAAAAERPAFGEQAYQPLKVQLKRKHWAGQQEDQPAGRASKRCTDIFNRQMAAAQTAAAATQAARDAGAGQQAQKQRGKQQQGKQQAKQQQQGSKKKAAAPPPDEAVRQQLIDAYRQQKLQRLEVAGKTPLLSATTQSLAELVRRDAGKESFHGR